MPRHLVVLLATGLCLAAVPYRLPAQADPLGLTPVKLPPELDRVLRDYETYWKGGDAERLAALFTEDGLSLHNASMPVKGRAEIVRTHQRMGGDLQLRAFAWATADSIGYIVGGYNYAGSNGPGGKYILTLRRGPGGKWLISADMDNSARAMRP